MELKIQRNGSICLVFSEVGWTVTHSYMEAFWLIDYK